MVDPPWVEARPPGALRCCASMMHLERREAIELVLSFRASLLSEVATGLSIWFPVTSTGFESKTNEVEKSYKDSGALDQKHRGGKSCDERNCNPIRVIGYRSIFLFRCGFAWHYCTGV